MMRDVMDALAELQAAEKAIETAGPLYQTREPLKDKIVCLIGQRSDLITQVLALRRELDAAHDRIRELETRLAIRRFPPSKKVLDERRPPAPWILLTEDPEPSPALPEGEAEREAKRCTWTYDETHCAWDSSCGETFILEDGRPNENRIRFCHGCGKPVEVAMEVRDE